MDLAGHNQHTGLRQAKKPKYEKGSNESRTNEGYPKLEQVRTRRVCTTTRPNGDVPCECTNISSSVALSPVPQLTPQIAHHNNDRGGANLN